MDDILYLDATAMLIALGIRQVSAAELLEAAMAREAASHTALNAVVATSPERALAAARGIDDLRAKGEPVGPLAGLPMTIKDTLDVAGMAASSGLAELRRRKPPDAVVVSHARQAGAVIWGKTNTPVMAADWQSYNKLYGTTNNPWDLTRTPGGSSGGAAAALAAGITPLEIGSDIGGSLRVPAAFCGVYSHKPTWGVVRQHGHVPPSPGSWVERDLNVVGPMARSARDLRLLMSVIASGGMAAKAEPADLKTARIGLWLEEPIFPLDTDIRAVLEGFAGDLAAEGATVTETPSPVDMLGLMHAYQMLLGATLSEDMPDDTLRNMELMRGPAKLAMAAGAAPLSSAAATLAYTARHRDWMAADAVRARLRHEIAATFSKFDVILAPITPVAAFAHDHSAFGRRQLKMSDGKSIAYNNMLNWISLATALGLPATAIPVGQTAAGLPVGAQLIGPAGGDARTLALAQAMEMALGGFQRPPRQG
jgi:amidase